MTAEDLLALRPLALGHDQDTSTCHWAQLSRRTAEYPSRRAQLAIAVIQGSVLPAPDVVALLYRCDDCGRCRASSTLPQPPDLARSLWAVRAKLVAQGAVPDLDPLRAQLAQHGYLYGDLSAAWQALGLGYLGAETLFVPDGAVLAYDLVGAGAALSLARSVAGRVALLPDVPDSGRVLRELGLAQEAGRAQSAIRQRIVTAGFRRVLAGTPKEAVALAELLDALPVQVQYIGSAVAQAALQGRLRLRQGAGQGRRIALHPAAGLGHGRPDYALIRQWLCQWLGDGLCVEADTPGAAWPAAVERPAIGLDPALARRLAQHRLDHLLALEPDLILTTDPFSLRALREAASGAVELMDLATFAVPHILEAKV